MVNSWVTDVDGGVGIVKETLFAAWALVSSICHEESWIVKYAWVAFWRLGSGTMPCPDVLLSVLRAESCSVRETSVVRGEAEIWNDQMMVSDAIGAWVDFAMVPTMVSDVHDEVVGFQSDCPKESDDGRETDRDVLHARDLGRLQGYIHRARARGSEEMVFVFCEMSAIHFRSLEVFRIRR